MDTPGLLLSNIEGTGIVLSSKSLPTTRPRKSLSPVFYNSLNSMVSNRHGEPINYHHNYNLNTNYHGGNSNKNVKPLYINNKLVSSYEEVPDYEENEVEVFFPESLATKRKNTTPNRKSNQWETTKMPRLVTWIPNMNKKAHQSIVSSWI